MTFKPGDRVVSTAYHLGVVIQARPWRFVDTVSIGAKGVVIADPEFEKLGWTVVVFDGHEKNEYGEPLVVPCGHHHIALEQEK